MKQSKAKGGKNRVQEVLAGKLDVPSAWLEGNGPNSFYGALEARKKARLGKEWKDDPEAFQIKHANKESKVMLFTGEVVIFLRLSDGLVGGFPGKIIVDETACCINLEGKKLFLPSTTYVKVI